MNLTLTSNPAVSTHQPLTTTDVHRLDPLVDGRWAALVAKDPRASIFHTPEWLRALQLTYGYQPLVVATSSPDGHLDSALVFCDVHSWLTGHRLVSLPFSDHCQPLVNNAAELELLLSLLEREVDEKKIKYVEIRPTASIGPMRVARDESRRYFFHVLDLQPATNELFRSFHKDCVQRKIRRAERESLEYEEGRSEALLQKFYRLMVVTRLRQQLPPQPLAWFRNLLACVGDNLSIHMASKQGRPVASILTLRHKKTLVYKYGCSDKAYSNLGGTHFLLWKAILKAKDEGLTTLDLGRSNIDNPGLVDFKDRFGALRTELAYLRYELSGSRSLVPAGWVRIVKQIVSLAPNGLVMTAGRILYRHLG